MSDLPETTLPETLSQADLRLVVELQKAELDRLLRENARLHERIAQLLAMQEREQVLRQQMQELAAGATRRRALAPPAPDPRADAAERRNARLKQALQLLVNVLERKRA